MLTRSHRDPAVKSAKAAAEMAASKRRGVEKELELCMEQHGLNGSSVAELLEQLDAARAHRSSIHRRLECFQEKLQILRDERKRLEDRQPGKASTR